MSLMRLFRTTDRTGEDNAPPVAVAKLEPCQMSIEDLILKAASLGSVHISAFGDKREFRVNLTFAPDGRVLRPQAEVNTTAITLRDALIQALERLGVKP